MVGFHLPFHAPVVKVEAIEIGIDGLDRWLVLERHSAGFERLRPE